MAGAHSVPVGAHPGGPGPIPSGPSDKPPKGDLVGLANLLMDPLNVLLIFLPLAVASITPQWPLDQDPGVSFALSFLAMVPLAKILGDATEELALGLKSDVLGGLLNATFGNAVEMIITIQSLRAGLIGVVKDTLLGSVLSNLLLVLGMSFFLGGLLHHRQHFSREGAMVNMSLLLLACFTLALPTVVNQTVGAGVQEEAAKLLVSRLCSAVAAATYVAYLVFQIYTHKDVFEEPEEEDGEEGEEAHLSIGAAMGLLFAATVLVSGASEILVDSIEGVVEDWHIPPAFIGTILLPIVGNACEHSSAIRMAIQDKMGISIGIAVGSSTQIALFVVPFSVVIGWLIDVPMDLDFQPLNTTIMIISVLITWSIVGDGESNWLEGFMLQVAYIIVCILYWFLPFQGHAS